MIKNILNFIIIFNILFFGFYISVYAQEPGIMQIPNSVDEAKTMGEGILPQVPDILKSIWADTYGILKNIFNVLKNIWNQYLNPQVNQYVAPVIQKEKPQLKNSFNQEAKEMGQSIKTDMPGVIQTISNAIKGLGK